MSLDEKFIPVRNTFYNLVKNFFTKVAGFFGYPDNPGLPIQQPFSEGLYYQNQILEKLPSHKTVWPPIQRPETWFEMIVGPSPKVETVPRYIYENKTEGFYNFYIENYKNLYFLPDWLSEFIQTKLNICLDITVLEIIREIIFVGFVIYAQIVVIRIAISWFIYINPYTVPWCYITSAVDWTEDVLQGVIPSILGVNITGSVFLGILGVFADSLNHIVFTMPFLPSEAEETKLLINQEMKDVLVFHYLPILWYRYSIPNDIREFWYNERPEILEYMQKVYKDVNIQFLPDNIIKELDPKIFTINLFFDLNHLENIDTIFHLPLKLDFIQNDIVLVNFFIKIEHFFNFIFADLDKLYINL